MLSDTLDELRNKMLGCWCAPHECHGDILAKMYKEFAKFTVEYA